MIRRKQRSSKVCKGLVLCLAAAVAGALLLPGLGVAQRRGREPVYPPPPPAGWSVPRTVDGHPDLRGVWADNGRTGPTLSQMVIDPPEGIPPLTPEAQKNWDELQQYLEEHPADTWKDRSLGERCVTLGAPMWANFTQYYKLVQNKDHVVFLMEWIHEARVIPLDGSPHPDPDIKLWLGDSRGRWEGDSLVVETTNYLAKGSRGTYQRGTPQSWFHSLNSEDLVVTERLTRVGPEWMLYEVTIDDPAIWTKPWTLKIPMTKRNQPLFEFACHEGNYNMANILNGARVSEQEAAAAMAAKTAAAADSR